MASGGGGGGGDDRGPRDARRLFVRGLSFEATNQDMYDTFGQYGAIEEAVAMEDRATMRKKGYGFVTFETEQAAAAALVNPEKVIAGRTATCNLAAHRNDGGGGGGARPVHAPLHQPPPPTYAAPYDAGRFPSYQAPYGRAPPPPRQHGYGGGAAPYHTADHVALHARREVVPFASGQDAPRTTQIFMSLPEDQLRHLIDEVADQVVPSAADHLNAQLNSRPKLKRLFVRGIPYEFSNEAFGHEFERFGQVTEAIIMVDRNTQKGKGFGFISFEEAISAANALLEPHKEMGGRLVHCNMASLGKEYDIVPSPELSPYKLLLSMLTREEVLVLISDMFEQLPAVAAFIKDRLQSDPSQRRLFVRGLPYEATNDDLKALFEVYGELEEAVVMLDRASGRSKGFGFVIYSSMAGADAALAEPEKTLQGRRIRCHLAAAGKPAPSPAPPMFHQQRPMPQAYPGPVLSRHRDREQYTPPPRPFSGPRQPMYDHRAPPPAKRNRYEQPAELYDSYHAAQRPASGVYPPPAAADHRSHYPPRVYGSGYPPNAGPSAGPPPAPHPASSGMYYHGAHPSQPNYPMHSNGVQPATPYGSGPYIGPPPRPVNNSTHYSY